MTNRSYLSGSDTAATCWVAWQDRRNGNDDIYGQRLTASGGLTGSNFVIANSSSAETSPALAWHSDANAYLVVWQRDGNVWARPFLSTGTPLNPAFAVSTASGAAPATQPAVAPIPGASTFLVAWNQSGFDGDGRILGRAVMTTKPKDDIFPIAEEPLAVRGAPTLAAAGEGTHLLAWEDSRGGHVDVYARLVRQEVVVNTDIQYTYDPLYRLTTAAYNGHITADYRYTYDEVGNMTAYTEQVNDQTTSVSRTFNAANQLVSSDDGSETINYAYDANGNLTIIDHWLMSAQTTYTYDQRNLLTNQTNWSISEPDLQAAFVYDGDGRRVQMVDHTGLPLTITYTNDILGMTQVLLADDGATTTANLFGLDLISQGDGRQTRFLLTDGLGSVRQELAGGDLQTTTTYEPYGNLLTQTGTSGTVYGFTGEQEDEVTGLVYLRARYYNPSLKTFISRDPFPGWIRTPASQHGYSYVHNNSVNNVDPTGEMCLLGFSVGPGRGCTDAHRAQAAQFVNFIGGFVSSPAFATGFVYELVDSVAVSGVSIGSGLLEVILKDTQIGRTAAAQLSLDLTACNLNPDLIAALLSPYTSVKNNPDPYFQLGRATGRATALGLALGEVTIGSGGTLALIFGTGGIGIAAAPATATITAHGAAVVTNVVAKEIADPLLLRLGVLMSAAWDAAGGGGNNDDGGGNEIQNVYSGKKAAPNWPSDFSSDHLRKVTVRNKQLLEQLRRIERGGWMKVYENGYINGQKYSVHYFQSPSRPTTIRITH